MMLGAVLAWGIIGPIVQNTGWSSYMLLPPPVAPGACARARLLRLVQIVFAAAQGAVARHNNMLQAWPLAKSWGWTRVVRLPC